MRLPVKTREDFTGSAGPYMGVSACDFATLWGRSHSAKGFVFTGDLKKFGISSTTFHYHEITYRTNQVIIKELDSVSNPTTWEKAIDLTSEIRTHSQTNLGPTWADDDDDLVNMSTCETIFRCFGVGAFCCCGAAALDFPAAEDPFSPLLAFFCSFFSASFRCMAAIWKGSHVQVENHFFCAEMTVTTCSCICLSCRSISD